MIEAQTRQVLTEYQRLQNDVEQIINWGKLMIELMMILKFVTLLLHDYDYDDNEDHEHLVRAIMLSRIS